MACDDKTKKVVDYLVYCISKRVPFVELVYSMLEVSDEMPEQIGNEYPFVTDGMTLYVQRNICNSLKEKQYSLERDLLHELIHIYLGHPVNAETCVRGKYDPKCNVQVENWVKKVYGNMREYYFVDPDVWQEDQKHSLWYGNIEEPQNMGADHDSKNQHDNKEGGSECGNGNGNEQNKKRIMKEKWMNMSAIIHNMTESTQKDLCGGYGDGNGSECLDGFLDESVDSYKDILRMYMAPQEDECTTDEEIDIMLYSYGFELYENVTFVEPSEFIEKPIANLVLAVDISGSCQGEMVQRFLGQTIELIKEISKQGKMKVDIYLILCDDRIQQEFHITQLEEFPKAEELQISGGGTNFVPVFDRVSEIVREKGNSNLNALFYYTDGMGIYPEKKPEFDTYFLMSKAQREYYRGPEWIKCIDI